MEAKLKLKSSSASVPIVQVARNFIALFLFIHSSLPPQPYRGSSRRYWPSYPTRLKLCKIMNVMYSYLPFFIIQCLAGCCRFFDFFTVSFWSPFWHTHKYFFSENPLKQVPLFKQGLSKQWFCWGKIRLKKKKKRKKKAKDGRYFS